MSRHANDRRKRRTVDITPGPVFPDLNVSTGACAAGLDTRKDGAVVYHAGSAHTIREATQPPALAFDPPGEVGFDPGAVTAHVSRQPNGVFGPDPQAATEQPVTLSLDELKNRHVPSGPSVADLGKAPAQRSQ